MATAPLQVGVSPTIPGLGPTEIVAAAERADRAGAARITFGEAAFDPLALAAAVAGRTSAPLAAGIVRWDRAPAPLARSAATVAQLAGRTYQLGIGPGPVRGPAVSGSAVARMRRYLADVRAGLGDDADVELELAAARPGMARLAGSVADGVLLSRVHSVQRLRDVLLPAVAAGEDGARRIRRAVLVRCAVDDDPAAALDAVRHSMARYEVPLLAEALADEGADLTDALDAVAEGRFDAAAAAIPEDVIRAVALVGPVDACLTQLARYEGLVDLVSLFPCGRTPASAIDGATALVRAAGNTI